MTHILNLHQCLKTEQRRIFHWNVLSVKVTMTLSILPSKWTQWKCKVQRQHYNCMANMKDVGQSEQVTTFPQSLGSLKLLEFPESQKGSIFLLSSPWHKALHVWEGSGTQTDDTTLKKPYKLIYFMNLHVETLSLPRACYNFLPELKFHERKNSFKDLE